MQFSHRLSELMKITNTTAYRLAKEISVHQTTIKNWLDGKEPKVEQVLKLSNYFGVPSKFLLCESPFVIWDEMNNNRIVLLKDMDIPDKIFKLLIRDKKGIEQLDCYEFIDFIDSTAYDIVPDENGHFIVGLRNWIISAKDNLKKPEQIIEVNAEFNNIIKRVNKNDMERLLDMAKIMFKEAL